MQAERRGLSTNWGVLIGVEPPASVADALSLSPFIAPLPFSRRMRPYTVASRSEFKTGRYHACG